MTKEQEQEIERLIGYLLSASTNRSANHKVKENARRTLNAITTLRREHEGLTEQLSSLENHLSELEEGD